MMNRATAFLGCLPVVVVLFGTLVQSADAVLVGISRPGNGHYKIDPTNGSAQFIVNSVGRSTGLGLTFLNGDLYEAAMFRSSPNPRFATSLVDLNSGSLTDLSGQGGSANWHGLAADPVSQLLYTIDIDDGNRLKSISLSGVITPIGLGTGVQGRGLAYDATHGILYAMGPDFLDPALYSINTTTGTSTLIGSTGVTGSIVHQGLAYDETNAILFWLADVNGADPGGTFLYTIDVMTGEATFVGDTGLSFGTGLAWVADDEIATPEPATALFCLMGIGLSLARRQPGAITRAKAV